MLGTVLRARKTLTECVCVHASEGEAMKGKQPQPSGRLRSGNSLKPHPPQLDSCLVQRQRNCRLRPGSVL